MTPKRERAGEKEIPTYMSTSRTPACPACSSIPERPPSASVFQHLRHPSRGVLFLFLLRPWFPSTPTVVGSANDCPEKVKGIGTRIVFSRPDRSILSYGLRILVDY